MKENIYQYPIIAEITVCFVDKKGNFGKASGPFNIGRLPNKQELLTIIKKASEAIPENFHIPTPTEFSNVVMKDVFGIKATVAGAPDKWAEFDEEEIKNIQS